MLKDKFGFNFWPSFTDLMLSLVLVVLIILFVVSKMIAAGTENLDKARESQKKIQNQIESQIGKNYSILVISDKSNEETSEKMLDNKADITIVNKLDRQTITFSDKILFDSGKSELKPAGYDVLKVVGPVVMNNLANISEIQIQGHADIEDTDDYNLTLAANRAIAVYKFLQTEVSVDPAKYLMSITSFGKYKPVGREAGQEYDRAKLEKMAVDLLKSLLAFQSEDGRWYQVVNRGDDPANWLENSCSCLYVAALCKAIRKGLLDASYLEYARKGYEGVIRSLTWEGDDLIIGNVCIGTGVGDYDHYIHRPVSANDLHGVGAFLLMCEECEQVF